MKTTKIVTLLAALAFIQMFFIQCSTNSSEAAPAATETTVVTELIDSAVAPAC